jgi:hypothetical protein
MYGSDFYTMTLIYGLIAGLVCGAVPMLLGATKNQLGLGFVGLIVCAISGTILGLLLAIPASGLFVWLIFNASKNAQQQATATGYKKCPYCAETILAEAKVCKHCGRDLVPSPS